MHRIDKPIARLNKKIKEKSQNVKFRKSEGTTDLMEMKKILRESEPLYAPKLGT